MLQVFNPSTPKANKLIAIGYVTQAPDPNRALKDYVAAREGVSLTLIGSDKVAPGFDASGINVFLYDLDSVSDAAIREFERFMAQRPAHLPVIALSPAVNDDLVRWFLRLKVADWIRTPTGPEELVATCGRIINQGQGAAHQDAVCTTFVGARGGVGATSVAVHAALLAARKARSASPSTCIVDLDLAGGACAEYLDLQPSWTLDDIIADPERIDSRVLDLMSASHPQGVDVFSAHRPYGEIFSFAPDVITRTLDLASQKYRTLVVDLPRHAESWSDAVLLGSSSVYIVTDFSVPGLRAARRMVNDLRSHYGGEVSPRVIVNKYSRSFFGTGLSAGEVKTLLGDVLAGYVAADDRLLREAIDRGVPVTEVKSRNGFVTDIAKILGY